MFRSPIPKAVLAILLITSTAAIWFARHGALGVIPDVLIWPQLRDLTAEEDAILTPFVIQVHDLIWTGVMALAACFCAGFLAGWFLRAWQPRHLSRILVAVLCGLSAQVAMGKSDHEQIQGMWEIISHAYRTQPIPNDIVKAELIVDLGNIFQTVGKQYPSTMPAVKPIDKTAWGRREAQIMVERLKASVGKEGQAARERIAMDLQRGLKFIHILWIDGPAAGWLLDTKKQEALYLRIESWWQESRGQTEWNDALGKLVARVDVAADADQEDKQTMRLWHDNRITPEQPFSSTHAFMLVPYSRFCRLLDQLACKSQHDSKPQTPAGRRLQQIQ